MNKETAVQVDLNMVLADLQRLNRVAQDLVERADVLRSFVAGPVPGEPAGDGPAGGPGIVGGLHEHTVLIGQKLSDLRNILEQGMARIGCPPPNAPTVSQSGPRLARG